jgi:glyoxylase-like metal-dependent hydrolase (beta-lactamase superfamily II)
VYNVQLAGDDHQEAPVRAEVSPDRLARVETLDFAPLTWRAARREGKLAESNAPEACMSQTLARLLTATLVAGAGAVGCAHAAAQTAAPTAVQAFPPGYVDPAPVLRAAAEAIGTERLRCVSVSGNAYAGMVGQQRLHGYEVDWPRGAPLTDYTRTMDWTTGTMVEEFDREPGRNPAGWKYGVGWRGGTPVQRNVRQRFVVSGAYAWSVDGPGAAPMPAPPEDAELWQLDMWLNPHGFLKAAMLPGANPVATWRWELGEMGRDGPTTRPQKVTVVAITVLGKYRVDATINTANMLQRIHTRVADPVLGDMNYEHEFTNASYVDVGDGVRFPTGWHSHQGWDDNYQAQSVNAGHNAFGGPLADIRANACGAPETVPDAVRTADHSVRVTTEALADGVWLLGGSSHNSVAVEFEEYVAVVEAPLDERRNLAVIDEIVRLVPDKPIRFLVNTHQHHDHIGGLRTYMHIGATIVTHWKNYDFYVRDVLNYAPRTLDPDMVALWPPTELAEGYQYETVRENYWLTDGERSMHVSYVHPLAHVEGMLVAYLPNERILIEADLFDSVPGEPPQREATAANRALYAQVQRLGLDVETLVPIHGRPVAWAGFVRLVE